MNQEGQILDAATIVWKIKRMAAEILELHPDEKELIIMGIQNTGWILVQNLAVELAKMTDMPIKCLPLSINKKNPWDDDVQLQEEVKNKAVLLADDVANSGRTLMYALKAIIEQHPKSIHLAVLVDRSHKTFPITPDVIGFKLSTTLQENVIVQTEGNNIVGAALI